jgi:hypothetical protein
VEGSIYPDPGEEHLWLAVRLKPDPEWTFVPGELAYGMDGGKTSDGRGAIWHSNYAHQIMIWTQPSTDATPVPPSSPYVISVPADTGPDDAAVYERTEALAGSGMVVKPGADLFVAIQLNGKFPDVACPRACFLDEGVFPPGRVLWASAHDEAPFGFFDLGEKWPEAGLDYEVAGSYE